MIVPVISILIALSAVVAIYFRVNNNATAYGVSKALTTILIIALSLILNQDSDSTYGWIITGGLIFSLIGDVLLLKESWFVFGLGSFLIAHLLFIYAFTTLQGFQFNPIVLGILLIVGGLYYKFLYKGLNELAIPVAMYILAIVAMDWQAISLAVTMKQDTFVLIGIGSVLFTFSDGVIAYSKFKHDFKLAEVLILSTYWLAIFLFCVSINPIWT